MTAVIVLVGVVPSPVAHSQPIDLSQQEIGARPRGFAFWQAGRTDPGHWAVVGDGASPGGIAIQRSDRDVSAQAALAVDVALSARNARIRARFKLVDGSRPSAGVVLRLAGPDDYYVVRAGAHEQRISLLHVVRGVSKEIAGVDAGISEGHWQTLEVVAQDNEFTISLDDRWVLTAFDYGECAAGQFGIWAEGDGIARFDQIEISPLQSGFETPEQQGRFGEMKAFDGSY
jgi:hypothetical protein